MVDEDMQFVILDPLALMAISDNAAAPYLTDLAARLTDHWVERGTIDESYTLAELITKSSYFLTVCIHGKFDGIVHFLFQEVLIPVVEYRSFISLKHFNLVKCSRWSGWHLLFFPNRSPSVNSQ